MGGDLCYHNPQADILRGRALEAGQKPALGPGIRGLKLQVGPLLPLHTMPNKSAALLFFGP